MQSAGTYQGDGIEHVKLPFSMNTLCGLSIQMNREINSMGYYYDDVPVPMEGAVPCLGCRAIVYRFEDFLIAEFASEV
jgi:hypothetical protein